MLAMQLQHFAPIETSPLKRVDLLIPIPEPGEIRIRVTACGICRTDLHVIEGELREKPLPIIPGHQIVGRVEAIGPGCHRVRVGERVGVPWLHSTCGHCAYCQSGKENLCEESCYTGYDVPGGFAEFTCAREDFAYPLPDALDDVTAAPLLCAGIIGYRALSRAQLPRGGALGIFGFGSSAHIVAQLAVAQGARVHVITRAEAHQKLARELGAASAASRADELPELLDSAILFAPAGELIPPALQSLRKGGTLAVAGIHVSEIPRLDYQRDLFYERDLRSVTANTRADGVALLQAAVRSPLQIHTTTYPLSQVNQALLDLKGDRIQGTGLIKL
ncbi:MAG: zinc-dependent alcohol dehydrogenase family protein [Bdellovibrionota bacterium]